MLKLLQKTRSGFKKRYKGEKTANRMGQRVIFDKPGSKNQVCI
jgi:hypothetical protein